MSCEPIKTRNYSRMFRHCSNPICLLMLLKDCISRFSYMKGEFHFFSNPTAFTDMSFVFSNLLILDKGMEKLSLSIQFKFIFYVDWHTCRLVLSTNLMKRGWNRPKVKIIVSLYVEYGLFLCKFWWKGKITAPRQRKRILLYWLPFLKSDQ